MTTDIGPDTDEGALPHEDYMAAVADELAVAGIGPKTWWAETPDGQQLDGYFELDTDSGTLAEVWPDGVGLGWDQYNGWLLIELGGGRNAYPLSDEAGTYGQPRQVATHVWNRLRNGMDGWMAGPICIAGKRFDTEGLARAVEAWDAD